jgi:site-specific DNA recombinase
VNEGSALSLAVQKQQCQSYCERQEYDIIEIITDEGQSGATLDRPGLTQVRELVRLGAFEVLVILRRDRLTREVNHLGLLYWELSEAAVALLVVSELEGPTGTFLSV